MKLAYKPGSVRPKPWWSFIYDTCHQASWALYPKTTRAAPMPPYLSLLQVGFTMPNLSLSSRCALTAPFHPYRFVTNNKQAVFSLLHLSSARAAQALPGTLPYGARTFLPSEIHEWKLNGDCLANSVAESTQVIAQIQSKAEDTIRTYQQTYIVNF